MSEVAAVAADGPGTPGTPRLEGALLSTWQTRCDSSAACINLHTLCLAILSLLLRKLRKHSLHNISKSPEGQQVQNTGLVKPGLARLAGKSREH